jgi:hypothetical protein
MIAGSRLPVGFVWLALLASAVIVGCSPQPDPVNQFKAEFEAQITVGLSKEEAERRLGRLGVTYGSYPGETLRSGKTSFPAQLTRVSDAAEVVIGSKTDFPKRFIFEPWAQVFVLIDQDGKVIERQSQALAAGP